MIYTIWYSQSFGNRFWARYRNARIHLTPTHIDESVNGRPREVSGALRKKDMSQEWEIGWNVFRAEKIMRLNRYCAGWAHLHPYGWASTPSSTWDRIIAQSKPIDFTLSNWSCMLTDIVSFGLMSVCRMPRSFRVSKANKSCRDKKNKKHLELFFLCAVAGCEVWVVGLSLTEEYLFNDALIVATYLLGNWADLM